jgi:hypothetical protein
MKFRDLTVMPSTDPQVRVRNVVRTWNARDREPARVGITPPAIELAICGQLIAWQANTVGIRRP